MKYALLPQIEEADAQDEVMGTILAFQLQGGHVFAQITEQDEYAALLGVVPSHYPKVIEVGMMHTLVNEAGEKLSIEFVEFVLNECGADAVRCQIMDDESRRIINELGFTRESSIVGNDWKGEIGENKNILPLSGKAFKYLRQENRNQLRELIRLGAEEESSYTQKPTSPSDADIGAIIHAITENQHTVLGMFMPSGSEDPQECDLVGIVMIDDSPMAVGQPAIIGSVVVHPDHRLNDYGRELVKEACSQYVYDSLVLAVVLETTPHVNEFFTNCGFKEVASVHRYLRKTGSEQTTH